MSIATAVYDLEAVSTHAGKLYEARWRLSL